MRNIETKRSKHYPSREAADDYLKRKLRLEAKITMHEESPEIDKERNRLAKNKSLFLAKIEDNFEAALNLIEGSAESAARDDAIRVISPEHLLKSLEPNQIKKMKEQQSDVDYFREKVFQEFYGITKRIFSTDRTERLVKCIFERPYEYLPDREETTYRITIANALLEESINELEHYLPQGYSSLLKEDFERVKQLSGIIRWSATSHD